MAKIGETDTRWIVAHRTDGKNVDNWHWNEKDLFPWAKDRFEKTLKDIKITTTNADIKSLGIEKADSVEGTAIVCNRKGKTIFVFDITLKLKWKGKVAVEGVEHEGKGNIFVEDLSNDEDKWKIIVKMDDETAKNKVLKTEMQNGVGNAINKLIDDILEEMKKLNAPSESVGEPVVISPSGPVKVNSTTSSPSASATSATSSASSPSTTTSSTSSSTSSTSASATTSSPATVKTKTVSQKVTFEVVPQPLYEIFLDAGRMSALSGSPAKVENKINSEFSFFGGSVVGTVVEISPPKKIVQKWRFNSWPENHYSQVTLSFEQTGEKTLLTLSQTGVPVSDFERTRDGWESYFWQRIRGLFGWSYSIKN